MRSTNPLASGFINKLAAAWLCCYTAVCYANTSLFSDLSAFDWVSLLCAAAAGMLGGAARTILALVGEKVYVGSLKFVLVKDMVVALIGGAFFYMLVQGYNELTDSLKIVSLPYITRDLRILVIVCAGASGGKWLGFVDRGVSDAIATARKRFGVVPTDSPASITAPLTKDNPT